MGDEVDIPQDMPDDSWVNTGGSTPDTTDYSNPASIPNGYTNWGGESTSDPFAAAINRSFSTYAASSNPDEDSTFGVGGAAMPRDPQSQSGDWIQKLLGGAKSMLWDDKKDKLSTAGEAGVGALFKLAGSALGEALTHQGEKTLANQTKIADATALKAQTDAGIATRQSNYAGANLGVLKPKVIGQVQRPTMPTGLISQPRTA